MATRLEVQNKRTAARTAGRKRRKRRKSGKRTLHYLLLILFLLAAGAVLSLTVFFKIEKVVVVGTDRYSPVEIEAASGIELGENLLRIAKSPIEEALLEQFPYIESVEVRRKIPPAVELRITQATVAGAISDGEEIVLIDKRGKVLERGLMLIPDDIPILKGIPAKGVQPGQYLSEEAQESLTMFQYLLEAIEQTGFEDITNVDLSDPLNMQIVYENRIILRLGTEADLPHKLDFIQHVLKNNIGQDETGVLDATDAAMRNRLRFKPGSIRDSGTETVLVENDEPEQEFSDDREENTGEET